MKNIKTLSFILIFCLFAVPLSASADTGVESLERLFLEKKYDKVVSGAGKMIDAKPRQPEEVYYLKGLSEIKTGQYRQGRESLKKITDDFSKSSRRRDAYIGTGDSYLLEGNTAGALRAYNEALDNFPGDKDAAEIYYRMAECYRKMGSADKAREYMDMAKKAAPLSFEAKGGLSGVTFEPFSGALPQPAGMGAFSVQVGCFANRNNAEGMVRKLSRDGFDGYIEPLSGAGDKLYRVKAEKPSSRTDAEALAVRLKSRGYETKICDNNACQ